MFYFLNENIRLHYKICCKIIIYKYGTSSKDLYLSNLSKSGQFRTDEYSHSMY